MLIRLACRLGWVFVVGAIIWYIMLVRWVVRNPEWADQITKYECPLPWFFRVWRIIFIVAGISIGFLICYYLVRAYLVMRSW